MEVISDNITAETNGSKSPMDMLKNISTQSWLIGFAILFVIVLIYMLMNKDSTDEFTNHMTIPTAGLYDLISRGTTDEKRYKLIRYPIDKKIIFVTDTKGQPGNMTSLRWSNGWWLDEFNTKASSTGNGLYWNNGSVWELSK